MKLKHIALCIITLLMSSCKQVNNSEISTSSSTANSSPTQESLIIPSYDIDQSSLFGVGDVLVYEGVDREDIDKRINLMKEMGVKSHRFWVRVARDNRDEFDTSLFRIVNNELTLNNKYYLDTIYAIEKLQEAGINHITLNVSWFWGKQNGNYVYYGGNMPSPNDEYYNEFMDVVYDTFKRVAELYPTIEYIEMGNEYNGNFLSFNLSTRWPLELKTKFIIDFSYYANKGIHEGNANCKSVLNGVLDIEYVPKDETGKVLLEEHGTLTLVRFFEELYSEIESGNYPTMSSVKSTNPDDYFEVIAYHPYTLKTIDGWIKSNNEIYDVVIKHNDEGKPVFITEWGIAKVDDSGGKMYVDIIKNKDKTPFIEVIHYYIFSDTVDFTSECLVYKNEKGEYVKTKSAEVLFDEFGINK